MKQELRERIICCIIAAILFFVGMSVDTMTAKSSFSCVSAEENAHLSSVSYVEKVVTCTPNMLLKDNMALVRVNTVPSAWKWNNVVPLILIQGTFLQYLFLYQKAESKEDAQLFLCRSVIIDYIHLKDSGE